MITRKDYLNNPNLHRDYYAQFVTEAIKQTIINFIGLQRLLDSNDENLNDIPLEKWDRMGQYVNANAKLRACGDFYTQSGQVSILKAAARQIIETNKKEEI